MGKTISKWLLSLYIDIPSLRPGTIGAYAFVVVSVAIATALRLVLDPYLVGVQFITFFPAVVITTLISGFGAGFICIVLSSASAAFFVLQPRLSFYVQDPGVVADLLAFDLLASYSVFLITWMRLAIERKQLEANKDHLQLALDAAQLGWWEYDPLNRVVLWSDRRSKEIFDVAEDKTDIEEFTKRVHPDDVERVWAGIEAALDPTDPKSYAIEYRVQRGDGEVRCVEAHGLTYFEGAPVERRAVGMVGTCQDITERKRAEEEREKRERELLLMREASHRATLVEESRDRLQFALDAALLGWWQYDPIGDVVWGDTRLREMLEIAEHWPNMEEFKKRVHPDDVERVSAALDAAIDPINPKPYAIEFRHRRRDGEVRWMEAHARVHFEGSGRERRAVSMVGTGQDITQRKQQEENECLLMREVDHRATLLEESKDRLQSTLDAARLGSWRYDPRHRVFSWDARCKEIFDTPEDGATIEKFMNWVHPDDEEKVGAAYHRALDPAQPERSPTQFRLRRGDGEVRWVETQELARLRGAGRERRVVSFIGTVQDITARKSAEEAQARLAAIVTSSADAIVGKTLDGIVTNWNEAAERMFGYSADEMIGQSIRRVIPADRQAEEDMILARLAQDQSIVHFETKRVTKDGRTFDASVTVSPVHDGEGRVISAAKVVRDITARIRAEEQVRLLMRETSHRDKNILSLVQAIARQTAARDPEDFVGRFTDRLQALAANQDLLVRNEWHGVDVEDLVRAQLAHFADLVGSRIATHGPKLRLNAAAAQAIGLAIHELATNAGKYGALSTDKGRVDIGWGSDDDTFTMSWIEREGPLVSAPKRGGFGSTVVERMAKQSVDGAVELDYAPSGVSWRLTCPAANALEPLRA